MNPKLLSLKSLRSLSTLQITLAISVLAHAVLLTVRFVDPENFNRVFKDTPLEVILVNAASEERPQQAQAIAQRNLAGGGEAEKGRAASPLPASATTEAGDSTQYSQRQIEALEEQQRQLLTQVRQALSALPTPDPKRNAKTSDEKALEERRRQLIQLLAEIDRRIQEENARPRKRYVSPSTREEVYAVYYDSLKRKIEDLGTQNFPEAGGRKLYGELTMIVSVNSDGRVVGTEVVESSGNVALDRRAQAIARAASPFGHFSMAMRRQADQIVVVSRFRFTREETLETRISTRE